MQVNVINGGEDALKAMLYRHDPNTLEYLQNSMNTVMNNVQNISSNFIQAAKNMYDKVNSSEAITRAKQILYNIGEHVDPLAIVPVTEENIFNAGYGMARYIMVQPDLYELSMTQRCSGYDDTYISVNPDKLDVELDDDYRSVTNGLLRFNSEGEGYVDEYLDAEDMHDIDRVTILNAWDTVKYLIAKGIDPTARDENEREL